MWSLLLLVASAGASDVTFLGFSPSGRFAAWETVVEAGDGWLAEVRSLDVPAGAWAHWPVEGRGRTREEARDAARKAANERLREQRVDAAVQGEVRPFWIEVRDDRGSAHAALAIRVQTSRGVGVLEVAGAPSTEACPAPAVRPSWRWRQPGDDAVVDLLRLASPRRLPPCVVQYELVRAVEGPSGALVLLFRAWEARGGDDVALRWVPASVSVR